MSAPRNLALGCLLLAIAATPSLGESMHSSAWASSFRPANLVAAENLAATSSSPASNDSNVVSSGGQSQSSMSGLFLATTGTTTSATASTTPVTSSSVSPWTLAGTTYSLPSPAPAASTSTTDDAFINFGSGPYPEASRLATGTPEAFFNSPVFTHFFGASGPTSTDIANFEQEVLAQIRTTYNNAGLPITLTTDPNSPAAHTISVVSGASYSGNSAAIGITDVGNNGFSFIDKFGGTQTVDQLATAIGNNISHELMHAFGIANHPEQTGPYVDAAASTLQTLSDPSTGFSPAAASLLSTLNFQAVGNSVMAGAQMKVDGDQVLLSPSAVPEPSTVALWVAVGGLAVARRRRKAA